MKILLVNYRYFISGGPEKYMFNIKKKLEEEGHEVIPFSIKSSKNVKSKYEKYFADPIGKQDCAYYNEFKKTPKAIIDMIGRSIYSFNVERKIKKEIKDTNPDIVYVLHYVNKLSPSVIVGAKKMNKPVVLRLSDFFLMCPRFDFLYNNNVCEECLNKGYKACIQKKCVKNSKAASIIRVISMKIHKKIGIYKKIDAYICPTMFLKEKLEENGFEKEKIFNVPTFTYVEDNQETYLGDYGLYYGRITPEKGVEYVIKAYEKLGDKYKLIVTGDDTTQEALRLKKYVEEHKINNIKFTGFKTGDELKEIIKKSRFVMVPSIWYENLPNTILESFANKKPVIASDIGSLKDTIKDGENGYKFKPKDSESLIEKIMLMNNDEDVKKLGENAYNTARTIYSIENHYNKLMKIFKRLIGEK